MGQNRESPLGQENQVAPLVCSHYNGENVFTRGQIARWNREEPSAWVRGPKTSRNVGSRQEARRRCHPLAIEEGDQLPRCVIAGERPSGELNLLTGCDVVGLAIACRHRVERAPHVSQQLSRRSRMPQFY